jgi:threonine aldolase
MLGGGMRQAGILAAAGIYALDHHVERLAQDHENATKLATALANIGALSLQMPQTNIMFVDVPVGDIAALQAHLNARGIVAIVGARTRIVTHLDVTVQDLDRVIDAFASFYRVRGSA